MVAVDNSCLRLICSTSSKPFILGINRSTMISLYGSPASRAAESAARACFSAFDCIRLHLPVMQHSCENSPARVIIVCHQNLQAPQDLRHGVRPPRQSGRYR